MKRLKIIVSAYGCEPNKGSESGTGWYWVECMAKHYELWVITRSNNAENIANSINEINKENVHFVYYDLPESITRLKKKERGFYWYYWLWQKGIVKIARQLTEEFDIDYVMHLTFGSIWLPTYMHQIGCPFIWGPVGGGEAVPDSYLGEFPWKERLIQRGRKLLSRTSHILPGIRKRCRKAALIIARTQDTLSALPPKYRDKAVVMLETAVAGSVLDELNSDLKRQRDSEKVRVIYSGRLIPLKAVDVAISAIYRMKNRSRIEFSIIGKGFLRKELQRKVSELGMEEQVTFEGELPRGQVLKCLKEADIFLFPSLKEGGTWALMEAMAAGLPCVCVNTSGMHVITDDECAIRIEPQSREQTAVRMASALDYLTENPDKAENMGRKARERIEREFTWEAKEKFIVAQMKKLEESNYESINAKQK